MNTFHERTPSIAAQWAQDMALGFPFWLAFLLVLEPGNVIRAMDAGHALAWDREAVRILGAASLGATSAPWLLALVRRFPIEGGSLWRHLVIHGATTAAAAFVLIALSCLLAAWFQVGDSRLLPQLLANGPLLVFTIAGFVGIGHALRGPRPPERQAPSVQFPARVPVKSRGRQTWVDLDAVDWIEAQGNYVALHVGANAHLVRDTLTRFEKKLDPARFIRIHRGVIVAFDRIAAVAPLANGDATVTLSEGRELRLSRSYRAKVRARLDACG